MRLTASSIAAVLALSVSSVLAQTSSSSSSSSSTASAAAATTTSSTDTNTTTSLIPTGISDECTQFMTALNADTGIQSCTTPLLQATSFYADAKASAQNSTSNQSSKDALTDSLNQLCSPTAGCQSDLIRKYLAEFWVKCSPEIKAQNKGVQDVYDVLYLINPFHDAVCTKDDNDNFCVLNIASNAVTSRKRDLSRRQDTSSATTSTATANSTGEDASDTASTIDTDSLSSSNIAFLFLQPDADKSVLCTSCSKNILASYIEFETSVPYAIGLSNSDILQGQSALYKSMQTTCGADFTTQINQIAGTTAFATVSGAAQAFGKQAWPAMAAFMIMAAGALVV